MGLIIDNFAGGGGASTGLEAAFGRQVDIAINHDEAAIAVHAANHPSTRHYCQSIYSVDPLDATEGRPVALVWFSPDCKHHSKAKGGKPRDKYIRDLAHVVPHWIERLKAATPGGNGAPAVIMLENVEEFRQWGPLDEQGKPIKERRGEEFDLWVRRIKRQGYKVEWRELRACDYGVPTSRKRLFLIARRDGLPIVWPAPTHCDPKKLGKPGSPDVVAGKLLPWRTAAECIDWTLPCPSIFDRKRPLKDATCRRIAAGVMRYVVGSARPFIVPVTNSSWNPGRAWSADEPLRTITTAKGGEMAAVIPHVMTMRNSGKPHTGADEPTHTITAGGAHQMLVGSSLLPVTHQGGDRAHAVDEPFRTITGAHRGEIALQSAAMLKLRNNCIGSHPEQPIYVISTGGHHGVVAASLIQTGYGEREGQAPRAIDAQQPLGTIVAGGGKHAAVAAFLAQHNTERGNRANPGQPADKPVSTITGRGTQQQVVQTTLVEAGALPDDVMDRAVQVAAFLVKYYGSEIGQYQPVDQPLDTITVKPRFAVVTVTIDAVTFVLVDIGMRMLEPRELARAQGFPESYILDPECWYRTDSGARKFGRLPKTHQIAKIGNSVCPGLAEALARANLPEMCAGRAAA
jgi:DNA (cytosine-5)-methyltransferase 1